MRGLYQAKGTVLFARCVKLQTGQGVGWSEAKKESWWNLLEELCPMVKTVVEQSLVLSSKIALASPSICLFSCHG